MGISMQNIDDILYSYLILRVYAYTNILHENIKNNLMKIANHYHLGINKQLIGLTVAYPLSIYT